MSGAINTNQQGSGIYGLHLQTFLEETDSIPTGSSAPLCIIGDASQSGSSTSLGANRQGSKVFIKRNYKIDVTKNNNNILISFTDKDNNESIIEIAEFDMDMQLYHDVVGTLNNPYSTYIGFNNEKSTSYCTCEVSIGTNKDGLDITFTEDLNCKREAQSVFASKNYQPTYFIDLWEQDSYDIDKNLQSCYDNGFMLTKEDALDLFGQLKNFI